MKNIYRNENSIIFKNEFLDFDTGHLLSPIETQNYTIIQVADSYYSNHFCISSHIQYCDIEITYPLTNGLCCSTNGIDHKLNKHDVYLSYKNDMHELTSIRAVRFQTLAINVKNDHCLKLLDTIKNNYKNRHPSCMQNLAPLFAAIVSEFVSSETPFSELYLDSLITAILVKLTRAGIGTPILDIISTEEILPAIVNYIDAHYLDIYSLDELSSNFGYTYSHICKTFRKRYGITPSVYLITKKMDHALMLLDEGRSVKEISEKLGYSTPYNFSRAFKRQHGVSPGKYKQT